MTPSRALVVLSATSSPVGTESSTTISCPDSKPWASPASKADSMIMRLGTRVTAGSPTGIPVPGDVTVPTPSPLVIVTPSSEVVDLTIEIVAHISAP